MDFQQKPQNSNNHSGRAPQRHSGFAVASMVCGIIAMAVCCTGVLGIPAGALSILFAVLSKRKGQRLSPLSLSGILLSVFGILLGLMTTVYSFYMVIHDPATRAQVDAVFESLYGMNLEEFFNNIY